MDVPGLSLFQGAESINVNNDQQRVEEEDAAEDRLRRNEELKNELQNAFDDLDGDSDDEDESMSINTTNTPNRKNLAMQNVMYNGIDVNPHLNNNHDAEMMAEISRLKNTLASKNEELRNITAEFTNERIKFQNKADELSKRLAIAEAEKERAIMGRQQTHELFVESKQKNSEQDEQMQELNAKIKSLDSKNLDLVGELERMKTLLSETQHKYHMVERNLSTEKHTDSIVKQINDHHAAQVDMMQQQINTMRTKLEDRESELKRCMIQNSELHKSREGILLDKSDTINTLTKRLDDTQRQCQDLLMKQGTGHELAQENARLTRKIAGLEQAAEEMQRTINNLTTRLESTTTELEQLTETAIHNVETGNDYGNGITDTPIIRKAISQPRLAVSSTPMVVEDRLNMLKTEFNRVVKDQRAKRQEILALKDELAAKNQQIEQQKVNNIQALQEELSAKTQQIDRLKADENQALIELTMSKETAERLAIRLKNLERELEDWKSKYSTNNEIQTVKEDSELLHKLRELEQENQNFRLNCNHLNETIRALEDERDSIEEKYRELCKEMAELQQQSSKDEQKSSLECEKEKFLTKDAREECTRLKDLYMRVNDEKDEAIRKIRQMEALDLNKQLLEQRNTVASLERSLQLAEMKYAEVSKILEREKTEHENQIQNLRAKYEQEISNMQTKEQKDTSNTCRKCIDLVSKVAKMDIENLQLQTSCSGYLKDIHELKKSLKKNEQTIADLTSKLALKDEHDKMIDELKGKAKQFEEFMRNQSPTKSALLDTIINGQNVDVQDKCVSTDDLMSIESPRPESRISNNGLDRSAEKKIREEMARAMALKAKSIENEFKEQLIQYKQQNEELGMELENLQMAIKDRETDISNLKKCILKERFEVKHILEQKDNEYFDALSKQENKLTYTRNELDTAQKRIKGLLDEQNQFCQQFQAERESMHKLMNEWKVELAAFAEREEVLTEKIRKLEIDHKATVQNLNEKYIAAKKTAANYKQYSEDKEKHIERESERIQSAYEFALENMKEKMKISLKDEEKRCNKRIAEMQAQLDAIRNNRQH